MTGWMKRMVPPAWKLRAKMRWTGSRWRLATPDRIFLEDIVIPWFAAREDVRTVLDIGVDWYTRSYPKLFLRQTYWTVDVDPAKARHASARHRTASMTELDGIFAAGQFDLVICNGVFGWGLHEPADVARALDACATVLRPGGWLVLGWNDVPGHEVAGLPEMVAARFEVFVHPGAGSDQHLTETSYRHRYAFFRKGEA